MKYLTVIISAAIFLLLATPRLMLARNEVPPPPPFVGGNIGDWTADGPIFGFGDGMWGSDFAGFFGGHGGLGGGSYTGGGNRATVAVVEKLLRPDQMLADVQMVIVFLKHLMFGEGKTVVAIPANASIKYV